MSLILARLGTEFREYLSSLEEASRLVKEDQPDRKRLTELINSMQANHLAEGLLDARQRRSLEEVLQSKLAYPAFRLDKFAADGGNKKLQADWIKCWNLINDGRAMASMPDFYQAFKVLKEMQKVEPEKAEKLIAGLRKDMDLSGPNNWLVSSTHLTYSGNSLDTIISHHYGCDKSKLTQNTNIEVPVYRDTVITKVVGTTIGLTYLQTLFDTSDTAEEIINVLEFISGKEWGKIKIWTASNDRNGTHRRDNHPERTAGFFYGTSYFHVIGSNFDSPGLSRGVDLSI